MHTYRDEVIEFWANVFRACRLSTTGLDLETFLEAPQGHLDELGLTDAVEMLASGHLPLMPEQAAVRREIEATHGAALPTSIPAAIRCPAPNPFAGLNPQPA